MFETSVGVEAIQFFFNPLDFARENFANLFYVKYSSENLLNSFTII